ncbi:MAG: hypothetical protein V4793_35900 [Paraburkholderia tropica]
MREAHYVACAKRVMHQAFRGAAQNRIPQWARMSIAARSRIIQLLSSLFSALHVARLKR